MHHTNFQQNKLHLHGYNLTQLNNEISNACNNLYSPSQLGLEIPNPVNHWTRIAVMIFMRKAVTCNGPTIGKIYRGSNRNIVSNIVLNRFQFLTATNNMIVKTVLPYKVLNAILNRHKIKYNVR